MAVIRLSRGVCEVDLEKLRGGKRHDMWMHLQDVRTGELHIAVTVVEPHSSSPKEQSIPDTTAIPRIRGSKMKSVAETLEAGTCPRRHVTASFTHRTSSAISTKEGNIPASGRKVSAGRPSNMKRSSTFSTSRTVSGKEYVLPVTVKRRLAASGPSIKRDRVQSKRINVGSVSVPGDVSKMSSLPPSISPENIRGRKINWKTKVKKALHLNPVPGRS